VSSRISDIRSLGVDYVTSYRLFEPLFTTKAKSTGLGLANCREIIERHGKTIDLRECDGILALFCTKLRRITTEE